MTDEVVRHVVRREEDRELLVRLDERTAAMVVDMKEMKTSFVTRAEFAPVRALVFGITALMLASLIVAIVNATGIKP